MQPPLLPLVVPLFDFRSLLPLSASPPFDCAPDDDRRPSLLSRLISRTRVKKASSTFKRVLALAST